MPTEMPNEIELLKASVKGDRDPVQEYPEPTTPEGHYQSKSSQRPG